MQHPAYRPLRNLDPLLVHPGPPHALRYVIVRPPALPSARLVHAFCRRRLSSRSHPAHSAMSAELAYVLDRINLQEYLPALVENGFDTVRALSLLSK